MSKSRLSALAGYRAGFLPNPTLAMTLDQAGVAAEDEAMHIGPWVAKKRKAFWQARFAVAVANCNARMITLTLLVTF